MEENGKQLDPMGTLAEISFSEEDGTHKLMVKTTAAVHKRNFGLEVRGMLDIDSLLNGAVILLDPQLTQDDCWQTSPEGLVDALLDSMLTKETVTKPEVKSLLFSDAETTCLSQTIQGRVEGDGGGTTADPSWLCIFADVPTLKQRMIGIVRLPVETNLGEDAQEVRFLILALCPTNEKASKNALETAKTFSTIFSDMQLRHSLLESEDELTFKGFIRKAATEFSDLQDKKDSKLVGEKEKPDLRFIQIGRGIKQDLARRLPYYFSDYKDGIIGPKSFQKTISTSFFLYFSILLPAIAFGNLQDGNTDSRINVAKVLIGQVFGGLVFSLFAGQPLVVVMTTAPLVLFTKIILNVANDIEVSFLPFYGMVGLFNSIFLIIYAFCNLSILMKFSSRSTEEIFSNFISIALTVDAVKHLSASFQQHYSNEVCDAERGIYHPVEHSHENISDITSPLAFNRTKRAADLSDVDCSPEVSLLYLLLMLGTVWFGLTLFNFIKTPYLSHRKRELLSDYALPVAVVVFSIIGSVAFSAVKQTPFTYNTDQFVLNPVKFSELTAGSVCLAAVLGFSLSLLFFMDQNISAAMVNSPENRLVKGNAYHWDLIVVAVINAILSVFGLPFMHAVLPHSPLHVRCLADVETRVEGGYAKDVVTHVRETRLTNIFSNVAIGISLLFLQYVLMYVPKAVLDGLFLYMAVTALYGNQMFERVSLLFTEQAAYPPHHYVKRVPQRKIHMFTTCQLIQLAVLCVFGFIPWAYTKMIFPVVILIFLPVRHLLIPRVIEKKYLDAIDPTSN